MENCHTAHLFRVTLTLQLLTLSFSIAAGIPVATSIIDVMKNDTRLCNSSKFLYNSEYVKPCGSLLYPTAPWDYSPETVERYLCLGIYDTAYKICQYSSRSPVYLNSTETFNRYIAGLVQDSVLNKSLDQEENFCKSNLQGFTLLYNETDSLLGPLVKLLLTTPRKCARICFDYNDRLHPLCAVLVWIKGIDDYVQRINKAEPKHKTETELDDKAESGAGGMDETNGKTTSKLMVAQTEPLIINEPKLKDLVPAAQKNINAKEDKSNASLETQAHSQVTYEGKDKTNAVNTGPQASPINDAAGNVPNKETVNDGNTEESNKKQAVDNLKTSTLSENTQDRYDAGNPEEDVESNIGDNIDGIDDTIQEPIQIGNQNENLQQEAFEQKDNSRFPNIRTEEDSHFFTYFTVITVACIAGYIGYHHKQKIFAIILEGRRSRSSRGRRRPSTASYRKLDCTLEEAVTSQCNANVTHVIY